MRLDEDKDKGSFSNFNFKNISIIIDIECYVSGVRHSV